MTHISCIVEGEGGTKKRMGSFNLIITTKSRGKGITGTRGKRREGRAGRKVRRKPKWGD